MRRLLFLFVVTGLIAATVTAVGSASHAKTSASVSPSQEAAWPWEPSGSIPAGTADNNWQYGKGDIADSQFSYWKQLNTSNVSGLKVAWDESIADAGYTGGIQSVPVVVSGAGKNLPEPSGTMFIVANKGVVALDPSTGKILWKYVGPNPKPATVGAAPAAQLQYGNTTKASSFCNGYIVTGQQDGSIAAINAMTGAPVWTNQVSAVSEFAGHTGQTAPVSDCDITAGPNHDGLVFGGPNGSSSPLRGHLDAIDLKTGALVWRWFTTPDPTQLPYILTWGNPAEAALGGGGTWGSSSIDPGLHTVFSQSGNAYAQLGRQPGKDLWTASSFALDENTGQLKWYWQEAHHDNWDLDHSNPSILMNLKINGQVYPAFVTCDKAANCEVLDRRNGSPLPDFPMTEVKVADHSGKGLALNDEYPTQPVSACAPFTVAGLAPITGPAAGSACGMANVLIHCPTAQEAALEYPTYPVGNNGTPEVAECQFASTYSDQYTVFPTCSCGTNYGRGSYDPLNNYYYTCGNNQFTAQENASSTDWHKITATGGLILSDWIEAHNMSNNTIGWTRVMNGASYVAPSGGGTPVLTQGANTGYPTGAWQMGCYGGIFTTAGNLMFITSWGGTGVGGTVSAFNATTGEGPLWEWTAPGLVNDSAMTYDVNGKQFVAVYHRLPTSGPTANGYGESLTAFSL
jgi:glucose dehydrogenase